MDWTWMYRWLGYEFGIHICSDNVGGFHRVVERNALGEEGLVIRYITWGWISVQWHTLPPDEYTNWPKRVRYGAEQDREPAYGPRMRVTRLFVIQWPA